MKRNATIGVLATLVLVLAGFAGASTASAAKFVSENWTTSYYSNTGGQSLARNPGASSFECSTLAVNAPGVQGTETSEGDFSTGSFTTETPGSQSCVLGSLNWNGCKLTFHPPASGVSGPGTVDIGPSGCGPVVWDYCSWTIPAQSGLAVDYQNIGSGSGRAIEAHIDTNKLKYTNEKGKCWQNPGTYTEGVWRADLTLKGLDQAGEAVGVREAQLPIGFHMEGEESEEAVDQPRFQAGFESQVDLAGAITKEHRFQVNAGAPMFFCGSGVLASYLEIPGPSIDVDATYTGCAKAIGSNLTIDMNSCSYELAVANVGPPYSGTASVTCANEGDAIELVIGSICNYEIPAQLLGSATYTTIGELNARQVVAEVTGSGVEYVRTYNGFFCPKADGTGTFSGGFTLGGVE